MGKPTIWDRVTAYLRERPGTPDEIGEALGLTERHGFYGRPRYRWGRWSFKLAEEAGLIEWREGKWHLKGA